MSRWLCLISLAAVAGCSGSAQQEAAQLRAARDELAQFKVYDAMMLKGDPKEQSGPSLVFSARNFTGKPISAIDVYVKYASFSGTFKYEIPGGVKPEAIQLFSLAANRSEWKDIQVRDDARLEMMITRLYGSDGTPSTASFGPKEKERLARLDNE